MKKISVISCFYNTERFVKRAISMLQLQDYPDFEVIMVNDGSTDNTGKLLEDCAGKDSRFKLISIPNGGLANARNVGLEAATGEFVTFFDPDDFIAPDWLSSAGSIICNENPEMLVYGYIERNIDFGTEIKFSFPDTTLEGNGIREAYPELLSGIRFNNGFAWNKIYSLEFLNRHNLRFPQSTIQQDEIFNHLCYPLAQKITLSSITPFIYCVYNSGNIRSRHIPDRMELYANVYRSFLQLFNKFGLETNAELIRYIDLRLIGNARTAAIYNTRNCPDRIGQIRSILENKELRVALANNCHGLIPTLMRARHPHLLLAAGEISAWMTALKTKIRKNIIRPLRNATSKKSI